MKNKISTQEKLNQYIKSKKGLRQKVYESPSTYSFFNTRKSALTILPLAIVGITPEVTMAQVISGTADVCATWAVSNSQQFVLGSVTLTMKGTYSSGRIDLKPGNVTQHVPDANAGFVKRLAQNDLISTGNAIADPTQDVVRSSGGGNNWTGEYFGFEKGGRVGWAQLQYGTSGGDPQLCVIAWAHTSGNSILAGQTTVLPVELVSFVTKTIPNQITLNWQTASETNNAGFEVQRSMDSKNWQNLSFIEGNGTTQAQQEYVYDDKDLRQGQLYYYRLKQIDYDGGFEYSKVISARTAGQEVTGVFAPNPAVAGQTSLSYTTPEDGEMNLRVFDVAGTELLRQTHLVVEGSNRFELDFKDLGTGLFFVKMEQGERTAYEKVVIE